MTEEVKKPVSKTARTASTTKRKVNAKVIQDVVTKKGTKSTDVPKNEVVGNKNTEVGEKKRDYELIDFLPDDYYPKHTKYGLNGGYVVVPYRVYHFLEENEADWFLKIEENQFFGDSEFLYSLLYYIINDGYVNIHEIGMDNFYKIVIETDGEIKDI